MPGRKILGGGSDTMGHSGYLADRHLPEVLLFTLLNSSWAKGSIIRSPSRGWVLCLKLLGREGGRVKESFRDFCFLVNSLKINIPKSSFRVAGF